MGCIPSQSESTKIEKINALVQAATVGDVGEVARLLKKKVNPNSPDENGFLPLVSASISGHIDVVELLLQKGAKPDVKDEVGATALVRAHTLEIRKLLIQNGASPNFQDGSGCTALMSVSAVGNLEGVIFLLDKGAVADVQDMFGRTALIFAAQKGYRDVVSILLEKNASPDLEFTAGGTALMDAAAFGYHSVCELLVNNGAKKGLLEALEKAKSNAQAEASSVIATALGDQNEAALLSQGCFYPIYVCRKADFLTLNRLIKHEEAVYCGLVVLLSLAIGKILFFSHRWLCGSNKPPHPDDTTNIKLRAMQKALTFQESFEDIEFIWVDYLCVPQENPDAQLLAINSLPYIVRQCNDFVTLIGVSGILDHNGMDEGSWNVYNSRGWCRLECLAASAPRSDGVQIKLWKCNMNVQEVEALVFTSSKDFNPFQGTFFDDRDKNKIALMVYKLCERFGESFDEIICHMKEEAIEYFPRDLQEKYR